MAWIPVDRSVWTRWKWEALAVSQHARAVAVLPPEELLALAALGLEAVRPLDQVVAPELR